MTLEELRAKLADLHGEGMPEDDHDRADLLLLEYIDDAEVTRVYKDRTKWHGRW